MTAVVAKNSLQAQSKGAERGECEGAELSLIHISEPTRQP